MFENTETEVWSRKSKDKQCNGQKNVGQKDTMVVKTPHRKLTIEQNPDGGTHVFRKDKQFPFHS